MSSSPVEIFTEINEPRRSTRARNEKSLKSDFFAYLVEGAQKKVTKEFIFSINIDDDPKTFLKPCHLEMLLFGSCLHIYQIDVKTAFLNGYLHEEVYMKQPEGFVIQGQENKVCRLVMSLYSLEQALKQWHERFDTTVISFKFKHNSADSTTIYGISETKSYLSSNFKMKDLDEEYNIPFEPSVHLEKSYGRAVAHLEVLEGYSDASWVNHTEVEFIALAKASKKAEWIRDLLLDIQL
ncbi:retrovirus-related pol polyprotein from transposon TNT 1-94 [Tanacetum coccineum]|uniref:Retrovirus-related pol polyprotein from transposon TNT 1-94 n=1 Tax=Tanacetum coccineum TaxID=301880 RepID=A0ABQ5EY46_9ASTR